MTKDSFPNCSNAKRGVKRGNQDIRYKIFSINSMNLTKISKKYTEDAKIALRNIRRDANESLKKLEKDKAISSDELKKAMDDIQKLTDNCVKKADAKAQVKEKEIMDI